ncbi:hypothetical protein [Vreelandella arcis]|uniref:Uncharacterized protein n=1 Tax=Vreelandella arcis TaxID=416873 RepID=A0A1G9XLI7_9GAMM|nr:hypothetical protein [Halomonas arcis]SDM97644.1 hypothetical protein SAMN04487951_101331 [Halomonas arcis]
MDSNAQLTALLDEVLQPRDGYFAIETIRPLLVTTIEKLAVICDDAWDSSALAQLADALMKGELALTSLPSQREKGIHGTHPIHGALYKLTKMQDDIEGLNDRLHLLAHIINAAFHWRTDIQAANNYLNFNEEDEKRLKRTTYLKTLESACKVARRMEAEWLVYLKPFDEPTDELYKRCRNYRAYGDKNQQEKYITELERFFAYALNRRQPRQGYQDPSSDEANNTSQVQRKYSASVASMTILRKAGARQLIQRSPCHPI